MVLHHHHLYPRWARLEAAIARRADAVITVSEQSRRELVAGVPAERVHVVRQGIATPPPTDGWPEAWPGPGLRLLHSAARGAQAAGARDRHAGGAAARGVEASLVIAGEGSQEEHAARAAGLPVRFTGRVGEAVKWRLYDSADVLLFGSTLEGFGLVVAEAQSRGVPVVAAAGTATAEALDDGRSGLLVAPDRRGVRRRGDRRGRPARGRWAPRPATSRAASTRTCAAAVAEIYRGLAR